MNNDFSKYNCIGILGGTFNPVHNGHIMLATEVLEQFPFIEQLFVMPNNMPAYKETEAIISSKHRINMLKLATKHIDKVSVSDMEIVRGGTTYTIDTLRAIKKQCDNIKIFFIIGADSLYNIEKWREFQEIFKNCTIITAKRDCDMDDIKSYANILSAKYLDLNIKFLETQSIDISSSQLRNNIKQGIIDTAYMDSQVVDYIKDNNLYGWNN